jgi:hypothetical protein
MTIKTTMKTIITIKTTMKTIITIATPNMGLSVYQVDLEEEYNPYLQ